jgi:hypothetical protein
MHCVSSNPEYKGVFLVSGARVSFPAPLADGFDGGRRCFVNACDGCTPLRLCLKHQASVEMAYAWRAAQTQEVVAAAEHLANTAALATA